jgi:acetyl-CoA C-acetyltransferase
MAHAVIVDALRTPFGKFGGMLRDHSAIELGAHVTRALLTRTGVSPKEVEETYYGTAVLASSTLVAARQISIKAGLPMDTPSLTVDRACCSSMTAIGLADRRIRLGEAKVIVSGGVESCSRAPFLQRGTRWGHRLGDFSIEDPLQFRNPLTGTPLACVTGEVAVAHGVSREEQDDWAFDSHQKFFRALDEGCFVDEVVPIAVQNTSDLSGIAIDESPRRNLKRAKLAELPTVYGSPTITAGNAPGLNDGASAALVMSSDEAQRRALTPLCEIVGYVQLAGPLDSSPYLPGHAIARALAIAGIPLNEVKRIEINEAFAAMPLVSTKVLSDGDPGRLKHLREITNINGGAVALGHPTGASGARLVMTLSRALRQAGGGFGVAAICGGFGQADALLIRV